MPENAPTIRVVVVDDDPLVRSAILRTLRADAALEVDAYERGADALARAAERGWAVALLDVEMPEMDGVVLAARLRFVLPAIRIVFVTGATGPLADRAAEIGPVLPKPW